MKPSSYITVLLFLILNQESTELKPHCSPARGNDREPPVEFLFVVDFSSMDESVKRLLYLYKAISCSIPESSSYLLTAMYTYGASVNFFMNPGTSAKFPRYLRWKYSREPGDVDICSGYRSLFEGIKSRYRYYWAEGNTVPFHVIILVTGYHLEACDPRDTFRTFFNPSHHGHVYLDIIAMNTSLLSAGDPGVRVVIEKFEDIDTDEPSLSTEINPNNTHSMNTIVKQYAEWIEKVLNHRVDNDILLNTITTATITNTTVDEVQELRHFDSSGSINEERTSTSVTESVTKSQISGTTTRGFLKDVTLAGHSGFLVRLANNSESSSTVLYNVTNDFEAITQVSTDKLETTTNARLHTKFSTVSAIGDGGVESEVIQNSEVIHENFTLGTNDTIYNQTLGGTLKEESKTESSSTTSDSFIDASDKLAQVTMYGVDKDTHAYPSSTSSPTMLSEDGDEKEKEDSAVLLTFDTVKEKSASEMNNTEEGETQDRTSLELKKRDMGSIFKSMQMSIPEHDTIHKNPPSLQKANQNHSSSNTTVYSSTTPENIINVSDADIYDSPKTINSVAHATGSDEDVYEILGSPEISSDNLDMETTSAPKNKLSYRRFRKLPDFELMYIVGGSVQSNNSTSNSNVSGHHQVVTIHPPSVTNYTPAINLHSNKKTINVTKAVFHPFQSKWRMYFIPLLVLIILLATILIVILLSCIHLMKSHVVEIDRPSSRYRPERESLLSQSHRGGGRGTSRDESSLKDSIKISDGRVQKDEASLERASTVRNDEGLKTFGKRVSPVKKVKISTSPRVRSACSAKDEDPKKYGSIKLTTPGRFTGMANETERLLQNESQREFTGTSIPINDDRPTVGEQNASLLSARHIF